MEGAFLGGGHGEPPGGMLGGRQGGSLEVCCGGRPAAGGGQGCDEGQHKINLRISNPNLVMPYREVELVYRLVVLH